MILQRLIDDDVPFGVISCNSFGVGNKDVSIVLPSHYADKYRLQYAEIYNGCVTIPLNEMEIDYFVGLLNTQFVVYHKGSFGTIYERKTNSLKKYIERLEKLISIKAGDNERTDT